MELQEFLKKLDCLSWEYEGCFSTLFCCEERVEGKVRLMLVDLDIHHDLYSQFNSTRGNHS